MNIKNVVFLMAHPDDAESSCGGTMIYFRERGAKIHIVVLTNGESGCGLIPPEEAIALRKREAQHAADFLNVDLTILPIRDGYLEPSLPIREMVVREIRRCNADLVITHPGNDYHPDHRAASRLAMDSVFMTAIPGFCRDTPALPHVPVLLYHADVDGRDRSFIGDWALDIEPYLEEKMKAISLHRDQMLLPEEREMPWDEVYPRLVERKGFKNRCHAEYNRELLMRQYGPEKGRTIVHAEVFQISPHGSPARPEDL